MKRIVFFLALLASIGCSTQDEANDFPLLEENGFSLVEQLTNDALLSAKRPQPVILGRLSKIFRNCGPCDL